MVTGVPAWVVTRRRKHPTRSALRTPVEPTRLPVSEMRTPLAQSAFQQRSERGVLCASRPSRRGESKGAAPPGRANVPTCTRLMVSPGLSVAAPGLSPCIVSTPDLSTFLANPFAIISSEKCVYNPCRIISSKTLDLKPPGINRSEKTIGGVPFPTDLEETHHAFFRSLWALPALSGGDGCLCGFPTVYCGALGPAGPSMGKSVGSAAGSLAIFSSWE